MRLCPSKMYSLLVCTLNSNSQVSDVWKQAENMNMFFIMVLSLANISTLGVCLFFFFRVDISDSP